MLEFAHKPVMLEECMAGLDIKSGGVYFDGTLGGGGHSYEILRRIAPDGRLIATDLDDFAIAAAGENSAIVSAFSRATTKITKEYWKRQTFPNSTESFWISAFPVFSWTKKRAAFPT